MDGARPPIRTGGATARAPFGGGLTAPGPYGRRVLRPAGAGPCRALPGGFGPVRGRCQSRAAASSARTACRAGWGQSSARVRQRETGPRSNHCDRYRRHGRRDGAGGRSAPGAEFPPSRSGGRRAAAHPHAWVPSPPERRFGENGAGQASRRARRVPLAPLRSPSVPRRPAGPVLPLGGAESGGRESRSPPPPLSPSRRRGRSRRLVLTRLLFPARGDRSRLRLPSAAPDSPEARRL